VAEHAVEIEISPEKALAAVGRTAEDWGAELQPGTAGTTGGRLRLPVVAGLRRGLITGAVEVQAATGGSRVVFRPETSVYHVQTASVVVLLLAVCGGLLTVLWPFFPELLAIAPFGALLALGGWFLVISRLRSAGPEEFLAAVAAQGEGIKDERDSKDQKDAR
jgi:hypothetical protein